tara:strand:+ start:1202 stop:2062 length:861 start_codon:yes stop_codon:yes gene_type:complete
MASILGKRVSYDPESCDDSDSDSDDEACVESLMSLLDGIGFDGSSKEDRDKCNNRITFLNWGICKSGYCLYRDGSVLGRFTGVSFPDEMRDADYIRLGLYLNHDVDLTPSTTPRAPVFRNSCANATHVELSKKCGLPVGKNELILRPSELENGNTVYFKKKQWDLSDKFREEIGQQWPKFILAATSYKEGKTDISAVSIEFEVRSKEQSRKSKAAMGLSVKKVKRRRTAETEARASKLRIVHANIIKIRADLLKERRKAQEYKTRRAFMENIMAISGHTNIQSLLN